MNCYHIDTSFLINALETLANPNSNPVTESGKQKTRSALEFCNLLILYEGLGYDGNVGGKLLDVINGLLSDIRNQLKDNRIYEMLRSRLLEIKADAEIEKEIVIPSAGDTCYDLTKVRSLLPALDFLRLSYRNPLSDPERFLFRYLRRERQPDSGFLENMFLGIDPDSAGEEKSITGGRFYYGLLRDDNIFSIACSLYHDRAFSEALLPVLFMHFRIGFAKYRAGRSDELMGDDNVRMGCFSSFNRRRFLGILKNKEEDDPGNVYGKYDQRFRGLEVYSRGSGDKMDLFCKQSKVLPSALKPALEHKNVRDMKSKIAFLRACLTCHEDEKLALRLENIRGVTREYERLSDKEKEDSLFGYLAEILGVNLAEEHLDKGAMFRRLCWNLVSFFVRSSNDVAASIERLGIWTQLREMRDAVNIAEVMPMLVYSKEDWQLLCQIFGDSLAKLGEERCIDSS